jgi:uncharacterized surface protein with fasciclin (FAS1) repeats
MKTLLVTALFLFAVSPLLRAQSTRLPVVSGSPNYPTHDIIDQAHHSKDHTTLLGVIQAAGLTETLKGTGPFTLFAPTNDAFNKLPPDARERLLQPGSKSAAADLLRYHLVPGRLSANDMQKIIEEGNGVAIIKTLNGGKLTVSQDGDRLKLTDETGRSAHFILTDVYQKNGIVHTIDTVLVTN